MESDYWYGTYDVGTVNIDLRWSATLSIKTCESEEDSHVYIYNTMGDLIHYADDDNCGYESYGMNEDLLLDLDAGEYMVQVGSLNDGTYDFSLRVAIIGCNGLEADDSLDRVWIRDDSHEVVSASHPHSNDFEVVSESNCASHWNGALWSGWGEEYTEYGTIGITLTKPTLVHLMSCGSQWDTQLYLVQHFRTADDSLIDIYDDNNCAGNDGIHGNTMWNEDVSVPLEPGHYTVEVSGTDFWGENAVLEVRLDGCTGEETVSVIGIVIGAVIGIICFVIFIAGIAKWRKLCCFRAKKAAKNEIPSFPQSPGSPIPMLQPQFAPQTNVVMQQQPQAQVMQPQIAPQQISPMQQYTYNSKVIE